MEGTCLGFSYLKQMKCKRLIILDTLEAAKYLPPNPEDPQPLAPFLRKMCTSYERDIFGEVCPFLEAPNTVTNIGAALMTIVYS